MTSQWQLLKVPIPRFSTRSKTSLTVNKSPHFKMYVIVLKQWFSKLECLLAIAINYITSSAEFWVFLSLYDRISQKFWPFLGKWAKLIKFDGGYEYLCTWEVVKLQIYFDIIMCLSLHRLFLLIFLVMFHVFLYYTLFLLM